VSTDQSTDQTTGVRYDPYDLDINVDPYRVYRRLRDEQPVYYNEEYDFYALSRHGDVERGLVDKDCFSNARSDVLEYINSDIEFPAGIFIFEDPPQHTMHRGLMSRVFTPRKMAAIEPQVRAYCERALDPMVGRGGFDFVRDLGAEMPMRVIGMLLGIPEDDQEALRDHVDASLAAPPEERTDASALMGDHLAEYVSWRADHPSDDLTTELLTAEFEDETGTVRCLSREEVLTYLALLAGAGNETTTKLIGWAGKVLADNPDQRRMLVEDPSLIPGAVEELLRFEPPGPHIGRYVTRDVDFHGTTIPAGSALLCLAGSANRDERRWTEPDRFDVRRDEGAHLTFSFGIHFCLGAALARLEGRVALEEVLKRFPEWTVDEDGARLAFTSTVRGWETLPVTVP
jgi:cytochrome P450